MTARPRLFLDENVSHVYASVLRRLMKIVTLSSAVEEHLEGVKDVDLFRELRERDFSGIVTLDRHQLEHPEELEALRDSGLHWIGFSTPEGRGVEVHSQMLATLMFALPTIVADWPDQPHRHHVRMVTPRHAPVRISQPL